MNTTAPTAREQFTNDIALVLDNDRASYERIRNAGVRLNNPYLLAEFIRDYVETMVEVNIKSADHVGGLLIRQLCYGWSLDSYADYARDIMESIKAEQESAGV